MWSERFFADRSIRIHNFELTESTKSESRSTELEDRDQLVDALVEHGGFPANVVRTAVADIPVEGEIYS